VKILEYFLYICITLIVINIIFPFSCNQSHYYLNNRLAEANFNYKEIKNGEFKWFHSHMQKYRSIYPGSDNNNFDQATHDNINTVIERKLRIELKSKDNFKYYVTAQNDDEDLSNSYFMVQACTTEKGARRFNTYPNLSVWYVYPPEIVSDIKNWNSGMYDFEFFNDDFDMTTTPIPEGVTGVVRQFCAEPQSKRNNIWSYLINLLNYSQ